MFIFFFIFFFGFVVVCFKLGCLFVMREEWGEKKGKKNDPVWIWVHTILSFKCGYHSHMRSYDRS